MLRLMESRLGATLTASGAIYALRREAWVPLSLDTVLDDFVTPINARNQGFDVFTTLKQLLWTLRLPQ